MDKQKVKKIINIAVNVLVALICILALLFAIMAVSKNKNGYNSLFGHTFLGVESNSMEGPNKDSFNEGDIIIGKILKQSDIKNLKENDVITFWTYLKGRESEGLKLNTHRIVRIHQNANGLSFTTKGDNNDTEDANVFESEVVAKYTGSRIKGGGKAIEFMSGKTGFLVFVVIPSILVVGYCVYLFIMNLKTFNKLKGEEEAEKKKEEEVSDRERMRLELMKELGIKAEEAKAPAPDVPAPEAEEKADLGEKPDKSE